METESKEQRGTYRRMHKYSSARRDGILSLFLLAAGGIIMAVLIYLLLTK